MASGCDPASAGLGPIGRAIRKLIEGPVGQLTRYLSLDHNVIDVLERRAVDDSADFIAVAMRDALALRSREALWDYAIRNADPAGLWLEFGVFKGYSINYMARRTTAHIFGFDSFRGLQEAWAGPGLTRGAFDVGGRLPRVRRNVSLVPGWFSDTLPGFLAENNAPVALLHLDCDTYEATHDVLERLGDRLTSRSIVIMDDFHGFWGFRDGQFRAWAEFVGARGLTYHYAAFNRHAVVIQDIRPGDTGAIAGKAEA
jgi:hypothetical protein